jgi:hypothetical protein
MKCLIKFVLIFSAYHALVYFLNDLFNISYNMLYSSITLVVLGFILYLLQVRHIIDRNCLFEELEKIKLYLRLRDKKFTQKINMEVKNILNLFVKYRFVDHGDHDDILNFLLSIKDEICPNLISRRSRSKKKIKLELAFSARLPDHLKKDEEHIESTEEYEESYEYSRRKMIKLIELLLNLKVTLDLSLHDLNCNDSKDVDLWGIFIDSLVIPYSLHNEIYSNI